MKRHWKSAAANAPLALVSVVLAALLWVAVSNEENPTLRQDVPFEIPVQEVNVPRAFVVSGVKPDRASVTLTGPRDSVTRVRAADLIVQVDLSGAATSGAKGPLQVAAPAEVSVRSRGVRAEVAPASIAVTLEPEMRKVVPVHVGPVDALPVGYELAEPPAAQPAEATIAGAKENVDLVQSLEAGVKLGGLTANVSESVPLDPRDSAGHSIGHLTVEPAGASVAVKVRQVLYTRQVLVDPRVHGRPAPGYAVSAVRADPSTVTVVGSLDALNQLSSLPTQEVDVEGAASDVVRTVGLQLPTGVSQAESKSSVVVRVPVQSQFGPGSVPAVPKISGLGSGLAVVSQTPAVVVNVTGPLPSLLRLSPADVSVTIDAGGLGPGVYRLEPKILLPAGIQLESVVPDRVAVTIVGSPAAR